MPVPDFQSIMLPLLEVMRDGEEHTMKNLTATLAERFELSEEDRQQMLPSGEQSVFSNRVAWSKTHLKSAGLLDNPSRGRVRISELGKELLSTNPSSVNCRLLKQYPQYLRFIGLCGEDQTAPQTETVKIPESRQTPLELLESSFHAIRQATAEELLSRLKNSSPAFFEKVVVEFLGAMGYGGFAGSGAITGKSGDGGIDGIIKEDKLGLDVVCLQAKKWEGTVGRPVVQGFVGSMDYIRAKKGVIITTSQFSREALEFVDRIEGKKVVLIDGVTLVELMIEHNVGVATTKTSELKEVSNDFFDEDEG